MPQVHKKIIETNWGFEVAENDAILINDVSVAEYLQSIETDEYILDRCFDSLFKQSSSGPIPMNELLPTMLKIPDKQIRYIESMMLESGLVENHNTESAYFSWLVLNHKGTIALNNFDSYSDYLKKKL